MHRGTLKEKAWGQFPGGGVSILRGFWDLAHLGADPVSILRGFQDRDGIGVTQSPFSEVCGTRLVSEQTLEEAELEPRGFFPVILQSHGPALLCLKGPFAAKQLSG